MDWALQFLLQCTFFKSWESAWALSTFPAACLKSGVWTRTQQPSKTLCHTNQNYGLLICITLHLTARKCAWLLIIYQAIKFCLRDSSSLLFTILPISSLALLSHRSIQFTDELRQMKCEGKMAWVHVARSQMNCNKQDFWAICFGSCAEGEENSLCL